MKILQPHRKPGKLIQNGVLLKIHEHETIQTLLWYFKIIELIPKSEKYGVHTADAHLDEITWELKCLKGSGKYVIANLIKKALRQSENIVVDLRRSKIPETKCIRELNKIFSERKKLKQLLVITKNEKVIDIC